MFQKLVSNLPFSPALVGQLGFYAKRLKKEEVSRRLGLVFTVLALIVQSFAVFSPPESANASNPSDMIYGGVGSVQEILSVYDQSSADYKESMDYAGVTRAEIAAMTDGSVNSIQFGKGEDSVKSWGRLSRFSEAQGEVKHVIPLDDGGTTTLYSKPLWLYDSTEYTMEHGSTYDAFVGHSAKLGWFAIVKDCGNLITQETPQPAPRGAFITATCDVITGYAYDARKLDAKINVYLYFGGPPGAGTRVGPFLADDATPTSPAGGGHGFNYPVPEQYRESETPTDVWGVLVPLPGWPVSTIQFPNTAQIPGGCIDEQAPPVAKCESLSVKKIERTRFNMTATSITKHGAKITEYRFKVTDKNQKIVYSKTIKTSKLKVTTANFDLPEGRYLAQVTIDSSTGTHTSSACEAEIRVAPPDKCPLNPELPENDPLCQPCPGNPELWINDPKCEAEIVQSKTVKNLSHDAVNATTITAKAGDRLEYTINVENVGSDSTGVVISEQLNDVLEYAELKELGGATFDEAKGTLTWPRLNLKPNQRESKKFVVQVLTTIPATPQGSSEPSSYDCVITNSYGNTTSVSIDCPPPKNVEETINQLPSTGPAENILFGAGLLMVVTYFYARSRQLKKEVRLIRHDLNAGTI